MGFEQDSVRIWCDSQSAMCLAKNNIHHERTKHVSRKLHFIRDIIEKGEVTVEKIHTSKNPADILTKAVPVKKFEAALRVLGSAIPCINRLRVVHPSRRPGCCDSGKLRMSSVGPICSLSRKRSEIRVPSTQVDHLREAISWQEKDRRREEEYRITSYQELKHTLNKKSFSYYSINQA
ncbi:Uncharacterized protein Rs2_16091 [Raphanus sativus]|nr:Uncharacterized protein Rs2_16091 [Raphanus sativus]